MVLSPVSVWSPSVKHSSRPGGNWQSVECSSVFSRVSGFGFTLSERDELTSPGGFFPGCVYLVSCWYPRYQTASRMAVFYLTSMVISGFSNIIGYGMSLLAPRGGLQGWQWGESSPAESPTDLMYTVFLLFGIITVTLGICALFLIVDFPEKSTFLSPEQKAWAIQRIERDRGDSVPDKMTGSTIKRDLTDWKIWAYAYLFMSATCGSYACESGLIRFSRND